MELSNVGERQEGICISADPTTQAPAASLLARSLVAAVVGALAGLALVVMAAAPASAYAIHGCEYDNNSINPISYRFFSVNAAYEAAFTGAQAAWDGTSAPGYFSEQSCSWDPEINVTDGVYSGTWWAQASWGCNGGLYSGNEVNIKFDTNDMSGLSANEKKIVAMHEIGHAYGLGHMQSGCHVMRQGTYKFTCGAMPSSDDVAGVHAIY